MKDLVVFPGVAAHGSACSLGDPYHRGPCAVWQTRGSGGHWQQRVLCHTDLWGSREPAFPGQGAEIPPASHRAKCLVTGLANTLSAPFWLLAGAILSCFCRDGHCHCIHVSLPSIPPICSTPIQVRAFTRLPAPPQWYTKIFFCRCIIHLDFHISEVAHS